MAEQASVVEELIRVLRQPHIAADIERRQFGDIRIKTQDGRVVDVYVGGHIRPLPAA